MFVFLLRGYSAKQIARCLNISSRTVEAHLNNLKIAFNVRNRAELISECIALGLASNIPKSLLNLDLNSMLKEA